MASKIEWEQVKEKITEMQNNCLNQAISRGITEREADVQRGRYGALKELASYFEKLERN